MPLPVPSYRQQVLEICQEAFENEGYSRHFTDPVLKERLPGVAYIVGMSDPPGHFVLFCKLQKGGKAYARQWLMSCIFILRLSHDEVDVVRLALK